jgi:predicted metal-dependent phosphoesterase TrpH
MHTEYSIDCKTPLTRIIERCQEKGINCIAITDHDTIEGALKMQEIAPFKVIVAEEIETPVGEIIGLFLKEKIPGKLSVDETISRIKSQNGLVLIPHAYDFLRPSSLGGKMAEEIADRIDIMEAFNARCTFIRCSTQARKFAEKHNLPQSAGSDAHTADEIGNAYVEMPNFQGRDDFLQALVQGKIIGHRTNPLRHVNSAIAKLKRY